MALIREPIYQQLNEALRGLIRSGEINPGAQFLTEREVGKRFAVSRPTANKALASLVSEGLLEFRKGIGTFVREGTLCYDLRALVSFTDKARAAGRKPSTRVLAFEERAAGDSETEAIAALHLHLGDPVYCLERLRLADGGPVILERRHIAAALCPGLRKSDTAGSLYALWTGRYKLEIAGADESIRAVNLNAEDARLLGVGKGAAGLLVIATGFLAGGQPLWHERTLYRGDAYAFQNRLGPVRSGGPAVGVLV
jgi:GntR family transcriptional regulator